MSSEKSTRHYASSHYTKTQHASSQYPSTQYRSTQTELSEGMKAPADGDLMRRLIGLGLGIVLALLVYFLLPADTGVWPRLTGATAVLMAVWWMTEAIPIPATALLPLVIFPVFVPAEETPEGEGVSFDTVGANYGNNVIFLFLGGFLLALAMQRWNLHRRIALLVLRSMGSNSSALVGGFMISTGFLSMWVSNTATAVMMLPIGVSVLVLVNQVTEEGDAEASVESMVKTKFGTALMLGIAYAASIGSVSTIIGTPPNALLAAHMSSNEDMTIGFGQWMLVGVPLAVVLMLATWFILVKVLFKPEIKHIPGGREMLQKESEKLGPVSSGERRVLIIFILAAVSWVFIPLLSEYVLGLEDAFISDAGIAIAVGLLLFLLPAGPDAESGVRLLDWESAVELPWGVLLLFGGGLALSGQFSDSGLSEWLGEQATSLSGMSLWILVALAAVAILLLTEMTSNTATAATFLPVASGVAMGTGVEPLMLCAPVALAATCAFMLPVATPPNAIAYGSGYVTIGQMVRGGVLVNIVAAILITLVSMTLLVWAFL